MEILIAVFLFGVILSTIFVSYTATFRMIEDTGSQTEVYAMARTAMERIIEDLGSVYLPEEESGDAAEAERVSFRGSEKEIDAHRFSALRFVSTAHLDFEKDQTLPELAEISYFVREAPGENGIALYRSDTPVQQTSPEEETGGLLLCDGLTRFECTFYDAAGREQETWGITETSSKKGIPSMVSITLEFKNKSNPEAPLKFRSAVALPSAGNNQGL